MVTGEERRKSRWPLLAYGRGEGRKGRGVTGAAGGATATCSGLPITRGGNDSQRKAIRKRVRVLRAVA